MNNYFTLNRVAEGVWAAIVIPGSGALGNAAIVDLGDMTIVIDTFCLPEAANVLRQKAEERTGKPVKYVANTHFHGDHHFGNQSFTDSIIISHARTREMLAQDPMDVEVWQKALHKQLDELKAFASPDPRVQKANGYEILDKEHLIAALPSIRTNLASITFSDQMVIQGAKRSIEMRSFGGGHSKSDSFIYVPDEKILIAGDLVLGKAHPAIMYGDPVSWISIIDRLQNEYEIKQVIPGHGNVVGMESLQEMKDYLKDIQKYAKQAAASGDSLEQWLQKGVLEPYDEWDMSHIYEWNFTWLFNQLKSNHT